MDWYIPEGKGDIFIGMWRRDAAPPMVADGVWESCYRILRMESAACVAVTAECRHSGGCDRGGGVAALLCDWCGCVFGESGGVGGLEETFFVVEQGAGGAVGVFDCEFYLELAAVEVACPEVVFVNQTAFNNGGIGSVDKQVAVMTDSGQSSLAIVVEVVFFGVFSDFFDFFKKDINIVFSETFFYYLTFCHRDKPIFFKFAFPDNISISLSGPCAYCELFFSIIGVVNHYCRHKGCFKLIEVYCHDLFGDIVSGCYLEKRQLAGVGEEVVAVPVEAGSAGKA